jgi:hypothetical protein
MVGLLGTGTGGVGDAIKVVIDLFNILVSVAYTPLRVLTGIIQGITQSLKDGNTFWEVLVNAIIEGVNKVLGPKFFITENEYPFVCDPFDVSDYDVFFEKYSRKSLTTLNSHLLLNSGNIINNNIFLCLAGDVLTYAESNSISQETTTKVYYPFLYEKGINNLEELEEENKKLIESNKKILNSKTLETFQTIDMFYDVYKLRKTELNYISKGIKYIKAVVKPDFFIKIPLEIIFKVIHATVNNPLIKYNPSVKQENVYRLYTGDNISTDGRKIPYLKKAVIFKLMKTIGKTKSVTVYVEYKENEK